MKKQINKGTRMKYFCLILCAGSSAILAMERTQDSLPSKKRRIESSEQSAKSELAQQAQPVEPQMRAIANILGRFETATGEEKIAIVRSLSMANVEIKAQLLIEVVKKLQTMDKEKKAIEEDVIIFEDGLAECQRSALESLRREEKLDKSLGILRAQASRFRSYAIAGESAAVTVLSLPVDDATLKLQEKLTKAQAENTRLKEKIEKFQHRITQKEETIEARVKTQDEIATEAAKLVRSNRAFQAHQTRYENLTKKRKELKAEKKRLRDELALLESEIPQ
jgi:hypothetical protein